jgi:DNA-binding Xre family transcriptional regulator
MTLKQVWEEKGLSPTEVAGRAGISTTTLYKMNRKERVNSRNIANVCNVLSITRQQYDELEADK